MQNRKLNERQKEFIREAYKRGLSMAALARHLNRSYWSIWNICRRKKMIFIGIDPGLNGAICTLDTKYETEIQVFDMPRNKDDSKKIDGWTIGKILRPYRGENTAYTTMAIIELVHAMPKQGVSSMFNFGRTCGIIEGVCDGLDISKIFIPPSVWKSNMKLTKNKDDSRELATRLFPDSAHLFKRKKDDGRAEAALLAYYGVQHFGGKS